MTEVHYLSESNVAESKLENMKSQVQNLTTDQLITYLNQLEEMLNLNRLADPWIPFTSSFSQFFKPDELDEHGIPKEIDPERITEQNRRKNRLFSELYHHARALGVDEIETLDINNQEVKIISRINRLIEANDDSFETVFRYMRMYDRINHPTYAPVNGDSLFRCTTMNRDEITPYQELLLVVLEETSKHNIRRYKGQCCKQIITVEGYNTKAWKAIMEIPEFVHSVAQKETRFDVWKNLTSRGSCSRDAIKHLTDCKDIQFPEIVKNRYVWSFNNGIFIGKEWNPEVGKGWICNFYSYESKEFQSLDPLIVSCKYFDTPFRDFKEVEDWWDIPTPHFQSILDYQDFEEGVCKWLYVMGGRLCFNVGDIDGWQVIPFFKGVARSGKSTLITKVFKKFYEPEDARTLSNNIERKFGLSSIYDGFMFIAPEVKGDLCLEQAEFQSLVSGEDVSVARKYEKAISIEWKTPGILGGNEVPNWKDNSGSVLRRILTWNFSKQVEEADPQLDEKLEREMPIIMLKCIRAYLEYSQKYSDQDIWNVVPRYFKNIQTQIAMVTNSLQHFLASEKVKFGPNLFCPQKIFVQVFNTHCQENNLGRFKFNPDFYAGPFSAKKLVVKTESCIYKDRAYPPQPVIFGLEVVDDSLTLSDEF